MEPDKVQAVYELREAAEEHGRVEALAGILDDKRARDLLLDARLRLEEKTQDAIEACAYCGREHAEDEPKCAGDSSKRVIHVDFTSESEKKPDDIG